MFPTRPSGPRRAEWRCRDPAPACIQEARGLVQSFLTTRDISTADAAIVVSELITNTVVHAGTGFRLEICLDTNSIRISVEDDEAGLPVLREPSLDAASGRGLVIVDRLATEWGVEPLQHGKIVWCDLPIVPVDRAPP